MVKSKMMFPVLLFSGVLALGACSTESDRGSGRTGQSSMGGQAASGQSSSQIAQVQQALKSRGYDPGTTDGVMNTQTQQALMKFQRANGLPATGTVDAQTARALGVSTSGRGSAGSGSSSGSSSGTSPGSGESTGGSNRSRSSGE